MNTVTWDVADTTSFPVNCKDVAILLNGESQKTVNNGADSNGKLVAKKSGKKIKVGDRLQVRTRIAGYRKNLFTLALRNRPA